MYSEIKVSIIIPTLNRSGLLRETLFSVEQQSFKDWECLIIDDGSKDDTSYCVTEFTTKDPRFKYYKRPKTYPGGAAGARNFGYFKSRGKYIQWLDDDDLLSIDKLKIQVEMLDYLNNANIFSTCSWDEYWEGKVYEEKNIFSGIKYIDSRLFFEKLFEKKTFIPCHSYLTHRNLIAKAGGWNTSLTINDDAEFFTRILLNGEKLINTSNCYVLYRMHNNDRLSKKYDSQNLKSLLYSYRLMHAHLKNSSIEFKKYFKWKLNKIFLNFWKSDREIILEHKFFFSENGLEINYFIYYDLRFKIYKIAYPFYKKYLRKKK